MKKTKNLFPVSTGKRHSKHFPKVIRSSDEIKKEAESKGQNLPALNNPPPVKSLESYISFANNIPMLTQEEERELAFKLQQHNDLEAAQKLVLAHLKFVVKVARTMTGYGLAMADLIQEGNVGLMKAVKRFDPSIGVRLVTFAVHWIKSEMHDFVIKNWRVVKIATTKSQRKLFFNLRSSKSRLGWFSEEEIQEVAKQLNVKPEEVLEMEKRMNAYDMAFDAPQDDNSSDEINFSPEHFLPSNQTEEPDFAAIESQTENTRQTALSHALKQLNTRDLDIIKSRWLTDKKATLHELAERYHISAERVRQVEAQAIKKLKKEMGSVE